MNNTLTYLALLLVVAVLFWLSRQQQKNRHPVVTKLAGLLSRDGTGTSPAKLQPDASDSNDVAAVLEDIYQEFHLEVERLEAEIHRLATELSRVTDERWMTFGEELTRLRNQVAQLQNPERSTAARPGSPQSVPIESDGLTADTSPIVPAAPVVPGASAVPAGTVEPNAHYFAILDELVRGHEPTEICRRLGVGLEQVEVVQRLMAYPANPPQ